MNLGGISSHDVDKASGSQEDAENNYYTFFYSPKYGCFETREYLIGELTGCLFIRYSIFLKKENCKFRGIHFF